LHGFQSTTLTRLLTVFGASVLVDTAAIEPGGGVEVHRHPRADEFVLVLDGRGVHVEPDGEVAVAVGEAVLVDAGEWHGFRAADGSAVRVVFGYLGAGSLDEAGWEVLP
jgi:quercetin dioxygenase-like cupin family protein